jgi:uncharacterized protein (DUF362 family)
MTKKMHRREFLSQAALAGVSAVLAPAAGAPGLARGSASAALVHGLESWTSAIAPAADVAAVVDVAVVSGTDYGAMTLKAVDLVGGIGRFVGKGAKVALLPNVQSKNPGTFTKPEILRAVVRMCKEAGAKEIACLSLLTPGHWSGAGLDKIVAEEGIGLKIVADDPANFKSVPIQSGAAISDLQIVKDLFDYDLFINIPITPDPAGNKFTGTMKNLMGLNSRTHNRANFHKPNWTTDPEAIAHLDTCIVDMNLPLKPALNIVDATEIIRTNGPMGPGELIKPGKIVAGTDRVAVDAYCASILGLKAEDIISIRKAAERKLGQIDLSKVKLREARV